MVERVGRQTFAPKVAGSSPTGTHCDRRGEKTISGFLRPQRIAGGWGIPARMWRMEAGYRMA